MIASLAGPVVVAHRSGAYAELAGEQTTEHFERAAKLGVDFIEVDLRETSDGRILCVHDPEYAGVSIKGSTYSELAAASKRAGKVVPALLGELLEITRGRVHLDLELKVGGIEERLVAQVAGFDRDVIYKCFDDSVVKRMKEVAPGSTAGLLLGVQKPKHGPLTRYSELFPGPRARRCQADFVSPHFRLVRFGFIERMRKLGLPVLVWTVNDPALAAQLLAAGAGVISDQPELCLRLRSASIQMV